MTERFKKIHKIVMVYEGGYVNHPNDPGGRTYKGISMRAHPTWPGWAYLDRNQTPPEHLVEELYYKEYWQRLRCEEMPEGVGEYLYDFAVNAGIVRAVMTVQYALQLKVDGVLGPVTLSAIKRANKEDLMYKLMHRRVQYYTNITMSNRNFNVFFLGWIRRTVEVFNTLMNIK